MQTQPTNAIALTNEKSNKNEKILWELNLKWQPRWYSFWICHLYSEIGFNKKTFSPIRSSYKRNRYLFLTTSVVTTVALFQLLIRLTLTISVTENRSSSLHHHSLSFKRDETNLSSNIKKQNKFFIPVKYIEL
jgi:hypothetical protein